jgi:uncharacterized protein YegP (UPF0339 family)
MLMWYALIGLAVLGVARMLLDRIVRRPQKKDILFSHFNTTVMNAEKQPRAGKIEICRAKDGQFYFKLIAGNGECICHGEMHPQKAKAMQSARVMQALAADAPFVDMTKNNS